MITDWKNENSQHFETHANELLHPLYRWFVNDIEQITGQSVKGRHILDIGCGPGFMIEALFAAGAARVTGVDLSRSMLAAAAGSGRAVRAGLVQADVSRLPLRQAEFDIVFSRGSIFFWNDLDQAFSHIASCLKPQGTAILGGGYGLSSPPELVDAARRDHTGSKGIPRIDLDRLLAIATGTGGYAEVKSAPKRGFWLVWRPGASVG